MRVVLTRREALDFPDSVSIFIVALAQALCELKHEVKTVAGCLDDDGFQARLSAGACRPVRQFDAVRVAQQYISLAARASVAAGAHRYIGR